MRTNGKRWLLSRTKTSGSKRRYIANGSYAEERSKSRDVDFEDLPKGESIKRNVQFYNGKINYGLLKRFLHTQVGRDWFLVHEEILNRIPTKLLDYQEMIYWFVGDKVEIVDGKIWNKRTQKFIRTDQPWNPGVENKRFYVCPQSNKLIKISDSQ